jgi:hypothetical protein
MMVNFTLFNSTDKYIFQLKERLIHIFQYNYRKKPTRKLILTKRHLLSKNYFKKNIIFPKLYDNFPKLYDNYMQNFFYNLCKFMQQIFKIF